METVLTVDEVAADLRIDAWTVESLLEDGSLPGLKVGGEWRILATALAQYLVLETVKTTQQAQWDAAVRATEDPVWWGELARRLSADSAVAAELERGEFAEGSIGAHLKDALRSAAAKRETLDSLEAAWNEADAPEPDLFDADAEQDDEAES